MLPISNCIHLKSHAQPSLRSLLYAVHHYDSRWRAPVLHPNPLFQPEPPNLFTSHTKTLGTSTVPVFMRASLLHPESDIFPPRTPTFSLLLSWKMSPSEHFPFSSYSLLLFQCLCLVPQPSLKCEWTHTFRTSSPYMGHKQCAFTHTDYWPLV